MSRRTAIVNHIRPRPIALALVVAMAAARAGAQDPDRQAQSWRLKVPETAEQHLRLASDYRKRAAELRLEADLHRQMMTAYSRGVAETPKGTAKPWWSKQRRHCERLIRQAESLAKELQSFAEYHTRRAAELEKP